MEGASALRAPLFPEISCFFALMKVHGLPTRSIRSLEGGESVEIIDQTLLPFRFERRVLTTWEDAVEAIRNMRVRGAPLIGITGAWGVVLALKTCHDNESLLKAAEVIRNARPTAVNLSWAVTRMLGALLPREPKDRFFTAVRLAEEMTQEDVERCRKIGEAGLGVLRDLYQEKRRPLNVLTHCNAGWLATVDYGTALSPVYQAHDEGIPLHVWVEETRPRNQGLLTEWELRGHGVAHTLIVDNAGGHLMQHGDVDAVIVGADRITRRGDVANKIGTYLKALAAFDNGVPFYVAAPSSTVDWRLLSGRQEIEIENRGAEEVLCVHGMEKGGKPSNVWLAPEGTPVANPAFDVTPSRLVTAFFTERGVYKPEDLYTGFADQLSAYQ